MSAINNSKRVSTMGKMTKTMFITFDIKGIVHTEIIP
jgi:hypothetical protein